MKYLCYGESFLLIRFLIGSASFPFFSRLKVYIERELVEINDGREVSVLIFREKKRGNAGKQ